MHTHPLEFLNYAYTSDIYDKHEVQVLYGVTDFAIRSMQKWIILIQK